ncbi:MAG: sugar ABC transporter permease [Reyranella sp.]|nr:sugar ABC transporter permease [Reyranella sp.]
MPLGEEYPETREGNDVRLTGMLSFEKRRERVAWLFAGPATLLLIATLILPSLTIFIFALTDWQFGQSAVRFVGLANFVEYFSDPQSRQTLINTLVYVAVTVTGSVVLSLSVAVLIESLPFGRTFFRAVYFLPVVSTFVAMATVWELILHPTMGLLNISLRFVGLAGYDWLHDRSTVMPTLCLIGIWEMLGFNMVLFLAGLKAIPRDYYEAAEIDGASSAWSRFWTVTWPLLGPTTLFVVVISAIRAFRVFESVAVLTRGDPGGASDVLLYSIYKEGFGFLRIGYASAITVIFLLTLLVLTLVQVRFADKKVHY